MSIVKINQRGNILIRRDAIQALLTFEKGKAFRVMSEEEYKLNIKNKKPEDINRGVIVLAPLKDMKDEDFEIPF